MIQPGDQVLFHYDNRFKPQIGTVEGDCPKVKGHLVVVNGESRYSISKERMFLFQAMNEWVN